jgi:serine/threonine-protein kinase
VSRPVAVGDVIDGKYRVERVIGTGGMGLVVAATHLELGQPVAVKFLLAEGLARREVAARFIREARAAASIRGEHVARVLDVGRLENGAPYIVMEYLEGRDLEQMVRAGPIPVADAVDYVIQACDAMAEAHRLGIVHRDLKPANLFLTQAPDGSPVVKVLDFGISKSSIDGSQQGLTNPAALMGSPLYMSPEQMRSARDVDHRTDIWSLGAVLYELCAGQPPFSADSIPALIAAIMSDPPGSLRDRRPELPEGLVAIILRCLEKDRTMRFNDVGELAAALCAFAPHRSMAVVERAARILGSIPPPPQSHSSVPVPSIAGEAQSLHAGTTPGWTGHHAGGQQRPQGRRRSLPWAIGIASVIAVAALGSYTLSRRNEHPAGLARGEPANAMTAVAPLPEPGPAPVPSPTPVAEPVVSAAVAPPDVPSAVPARRAEPARSAPSPKPRASASAASSAAAATSAESKPKNSLKMSIKR